MTLEQDISDAKTVMQEAQQELRDAKFRFTVGCKKRNKTEELTEKYDQEMKLELKELYDSLVLKEESYNVTGFECPQANVVSLTV
jgi:hypothetical protein